MQNQFFELTPDRVLDSVEIAMKNIKKDARLTGRSMALNSLENRVYELEYDDNTSVVAKFYRPGRWTEAQILEEHKFTQKLFESEVPVVAPHVLHQGTSVGHAILGQEATPIYFAVFDKVRGRILDELHKPNLERLGRYLARIHNVGETIKVQARLELNVENWGDASLDFLEAADLNQSPMFMRYMDVAERIVDDLADNFKPTGLISTHGDCHLGNVLWSSDGNPFFLDFDDYALAPPVQDLWMIVRGRDEEAVKQREIILESYEALRPFNRASLKWIEPYRILRIIHYSAWIAKRWEDPSFPKAFPLFSTDSYWQNEIEALEEAYSQWLSSRDSSPYY